MEILEEIEIVEMLENFVDRIFAVALIITSDVVLYSHAAWCYGSARLTEPVELSFDYLAAPLLVLASLLEPLLASPFVSSGLALFASLAVGITSRTVIPSLVKIRCAPFECLPA